MEYKNSKILVIDDEPTITNLLKVILGKEGYDVYVANCGEEGVKMAGEIRPDLIFMDINMPDLSGYEATKEIKKNEELKKVPIIFLTGLSAEKEAEKAFSTGGASFLKKPFTSQQIKDFVNLAIMSLTDG